MATEVPVHIDMAENSVGVINEQDMTRKLDVSQSLRMTRSMNIGLLGQPSGRMAIRQPRLM